MCTNKEIIYVKCGCRYYDPDRCYNLECEYINLDDNKIPITSINFFSSKGIRCNEYCRDENCKCNDNK